MSNSSSASFCIGKNYMTEEQIEKFAKYCNSDDIRDREIFINESEYYFMGTLEQHEEANIENVLLAMNIDTKYIAWD